MSDSMSNSWHPAGRPSNADLKKLENSKTSELEKSSNTIGEISLIQSGFNHFY